MNEHQHQATIFQRAELSLKKYPELDMLFAIPNGGFRTKSEAARLKREGVKAGYPDIGLDVARGGYHGLRIELKKPKCSKSGAGKVSKKQKERIEKLIDQGYKALVCWGWEDAWNVIMDYLNEE